MDRQHPGAGLPSQPAGQLLTRLAAPCDGGPPRTDPQAHLSSILSREEEGRERI